jgi:dipeptidyl aminopeptidase/acylaminoacyl peptidase
LYGCFLPTPQIRSRFAVYHYDVRSEKTDSLIYPGMPGMPAGFGPGEHSRPYFSDNGQRLFVGTAPVPVAEPEDTLLAEEKYSLDIWHWQDPMLQSQQKVMVNQLRRRSFPAVYHFREARLVQLADEDMPGISMDSENNAGEALGYSPVPYMIERQWTGGNARDLYVVNVADGSRTLVAERVEGNAGMSPAGHYIYWYEPEGQTWMAYDMASKSKVRLMDGVNVSLSNELHDLPMFARPYGLAGWTPGDREVLVYDRYDIWKVDPTGNKPAENITNGYGRENRIVLRIQNLDRDDDFVRLNEVVFLSGSDEVSRQSGYFRLNRGRLEKVTMEDASLSGLQKAKDADRFIFRKSTYNDFPDLWTSDSDMSEAVKISDANPQQDDYYWGRVQVVEWQNFQNETLEGLLYLPEDMDESKTYPMLVYFYERSSQGLHQHFIPSPSRSTINRSYCTSNGYIVFVPDITYETGFPGESAYNAIVSGTKAMVERYPFIDRDNMGLQGQSWGGYQIAYLVTRTNMFKAAMAGAPVSNMVSAYGGIRWQTGINRQFQYEQTQSRIGGTLWEKPLRYIENSPVFFADKIETPLLIMHNDEDGAVPWYQGIELFTAMRRLSKPVWMLVYNGEAHNLTKWPNRMDLSVRMYQFFDYYLKGEPAPAWLRHGIPAVDKGRVDAYELVD